MCLHYDHHQEYLTRVYQYGVYARTRARSFLYYIGDDTLKKMQETLDTRACDAYNKYGDENLKTNEINEIVNTSRHLLSISPWSANGDFL